MNIKIKRLHDKAIVPFTNGDRVGQMMIIPIPFIRFEEVDNLSDTLRGDGGFGHTGI